MIFIFEIFPYLLALILKIGLFVIVPLWTIVKCLDYNYIQPATATTPSHILLFLGFVYCFYAIIQPLISNESCVLLLLGLIIGGFLLLRTGVISKLINSVLNFEGLKRKKNK